MPRHKARPFWMAAALLAAGCSTSPVETGPTLKELARKDAPEPEQLEARPTPPPEPSPAAALENYRRIADLATDPATRAEANRRLADLQIQIDEAAIADDASEARLRDSIARYRALLEERPNEGDNDRLLYQLARAHQNMGEWQPAAAVLQQLLQQHPQSRYAEDARFRRAELLFRAKDYAGAAEEYTRVLGLGANTPYFEPAQYKYGWALFKLGRYDEALAVFLPILERELPAGEVHEPQAALAGVSSAKRDLAADALRVSVLSFIAMGGAPALERHLAQHGRPDFFPLLYNHLGEQLLERKRYTDAAASFAAFQRQAPQHRLAPFFQNRVIAAHEAGGFEELALAEKERFARAFDPASAYWAGRSPDAEVLADLQRHLGDAARAHHARGQKLSDAEGKAREQALLAAARAYRRWVDLFPQDPRAPEFHFLLAEALMDAGRTLAAAHEYRRVASAYPAHARAPEAGYAAVLAYQKHAEALPAAEQSEALRQAVGAALSFASAFPAHAGADAALVRAAEDLFRLKDLDGALRAAERALARPGLAADLRRTALIVQADAHFGLSHWAAAEAAYQQVLAAGGPAADDEGLRERFAAAIYKQGEAARAQGALAEAAAYFRRVGTAVPGAALRATAEHDAAALLIQLEDWSGALALLEPFSRRYPGHALEAEVDKKLAVAYQRAGQKARAATVLQRIAARSGEPGELRREAAWTAANLLEDTGDRAAAAAAWQAYVEQFPLPLEPALDARSRLAQWAGERGDVRRQQHWLEGILTAAGSGNAGTSPRVRLFAAQAALELGRLAVREAEAVALRMPLERSLPRKKEASDRAIAALGRAARYGIAEVTTAASFEMGRLYQHLARALMTSERPRGLSGLELEQYDLLLEEQAFPFEEKAIEWHEANLKRLREGLYNDWIGRSAAALAALVPGQYGKQEQGEDRYDALH